jgi:cytochrome c peroxidase
LRNIALTAPYMHDGRFNTLEEVLDHYSHGVAAHPNLDGRLKDSMGQPLIQNIPEEDKIKLIAFMNALTDESFITDPAFSDPFSE